MRIFLTLKGQKCLMADAISGLVASLNHPCISPPPMFHIKNQKL